ncbi:TIGR03854 family LLM class F420-dependent oxidoreductase [Embleya sp. NBC_00896]|uniref:TIGR03854 family LLM class F420-dependent oxidoreductase n=1 Tax=Embleya sp. NBC_00896 TaxID=2975961 RepID=UPI003869DA47|nr:TIGR03854 family LLM class F420-dependent oxidoreductase [Embleya sp. NBC_00896]
MKLRIGVGLGPRDPADPATFGQLVDHMERIGVDSLWLPDLIGGDLPDPLVGIGYAAGRTERLKLGSGVTVLPGRNPVAVAKELATLAALAPRRILPVFGVQHATARERPLFPIPGPRGEVMDEALTLVRLLLADEDVTFEGKYYACEGVTVRPRPTRPLDLWLGGSGPKSLRRVGRLADGWLGAALTPDEAGLGRRAIEAAAAEAGRGIDDDHYGMSLVVAFDGVTGRDFGALRRQRPDVDIADLVPSGWAATRALIRRYADAGLSKFVVRPAAPPRSWTAFLDEFAAELLPLEK